MPAMTLGMPAVPAALVPMLFPCTTLPLAPGLGDLDASAAVAGDHVAGARRGTADRVVRGAREHGDALVGIAPAGAGHVRADVVALDEVVRGAVEIWMPSTVLPEMMLRSAAAVPPTVVVRRPTAEDVDPRDVAESCGGGPGEVRPQEVPGDDVAERIQDEDRGFGRAVDAESADRASRGPGPELERVVRRARSVHLDHGREGRRIHPARLGGAVDEHAGRNSRQASGEYDRLGSSPADVEFDRVEICADVRFLDGGAEGALVRASPDPTGSVPRSLSPRSSVLLTVKVAAWTGAAASTTTTSAPRPRLLPGQRSPTLDKRPAMRLLLDNESDAGIPVQMIDLRSSEGAGIRIIAIRSEDGVAYPRVPSGEEFLQQGLVG